MHSLKTSAIVLATAFFIGAQSQAVYYIDPNSVPLTERQSWCQTQQVSCPLICLQLPGVTTETTDSNSCDATSLTYSCVCQNGMSPNASEYSQTLPYFICTEYGDQCVASCNGATQCQSDCRSQHPCGAQDPVRVNVTSSTSTAMASTTVPAGASSGTNGVVFTALGGSPTGSSSSGTTSKSGSSAAMDFGRSYGLAVVFAGLFAGFALVM